MKNTDSIVDKFAGALAQEGITISRTEDVNWIIRLTSILPAKYPPSFISLITRYVFDEFAVDKIAFFANHGSDGGDELVSAIPKDTIIFKTTTANGFLQFARPYGGSYDPICFDIRKRKNDKEYPVVRLDHEEILQFERIKVVEPVYSSLYDMMKAYCER